MVSEANLISSVPELRSQVNRLDLLRNGFTRRFRNPFVKSLDLAAKQTHISDVMTRLTGSTDFTSTFLTTQTGTEQWQLPEDEIAGLSPHALKRMAEGISNKVNVLWPWLLLADEKEKVRVDEYLKTYYDIAAAYSLFPSEPNLEMVPLQRKLDWKHRFLADQLIFFKAAIKTLDVSSAASAILSMINRAEEEYKQHPLNEMQEAVLAKTSQGDQRYYNSPQIKKMWENPDDVALMCVDRGLREVVLAHFGIMRQFTSGYHAGQAIMGINPILKRCLEVA